MVFGDVPGLKTHIKAVQACNTTDEKPPEGVTEERARALRCKAKIYPNQTDESIWGDIYQLLFPGDPIPATPCKSLIQTMKQQY